MTARVGKQMRAILDILQDGRDGVEQWSKGELWNDAGQWSASCVDENGSRFSTRVQAAAARHLHEQGLVMFNRIEVKGGEGRIGRCLL